MNKFIKQPIIFQDISKEYREGYPGIFFCVEKELKETIAILAKERNISPERYCYRALKKSVEFDLQLNRIKNKEL
jgi:hypothetical protein